MLNYLIEFFKSFSIWNYLISLLDILIITIILYFIISALQKTRVWQLIQGLVIFFIVVLIASRISSMLGLIALNYVLRGILSIGGMLPVMIVVLFQPEIRKFMGTLGRRKIFGNSFEFFTGSEVNPIKIIDEIVKAIKYAMERFIHAIVTMPISKESINMAGYNYPGHTEILADLTKAKDVRMMLLAKNLRVVHVTTHISLKKAIELIKKDRIIRTIEITNSYLKDYFDIMKPKIAIAGLNPHASENGLFGDEEEKEIIPAIKEANEKGINALGPFPSDSVFYRAYNNEFDAVIAMYHDQGHIPIKMIGFMEGVNITLGLPIIRVSPDHGTVWGKAGKGTANENATLNAMKIAIKIAMKKMNKI